MKPRLSLLVALSMLFLIGSARSGEPVPFGADRTAPAGPMRLLAPSDTVGRLEADSLETAALVRVLRQADFAFVTDLSDMEVAVTAVHGGRRYARFVVRSRPSTDDDVLLLRVTSREATARPKTIMDLAYRRVADSTDSTDSTDFQLVSWRPAGRASGTEPVDLRSD